MGGNALSFQAQFDQQLKQPYDLLIATSMADLSTLRSFYPNLTQVPNLLYFHENQFAYPENNQQQGLLEIQLKSILSACSADQMAFNSNYNQQTFLNGVKSLVEKMPDGIPNNLINELANKSSIIPVPIRPDCIVKKHKNDAKPEQLQVVWNHRWEHDKGPETLLELLKLCQNDEHIKFHIIGQQFRQMPQALQQIQKQHQQQCLNLGFIESRSTYIEILQKADVVLSTAYHDFQGIAMLEAVACGCLPIAPNRLVYLELYPQANLYPNNPENPQKEAVAIYELLKNPQQLKQVTVDANWTELKSKYKRWLD